MDASQRVIPMVEDDQGEGVKDPLPDEIAQKLQLLEKKTQKIENITAEEMLENLEEENEPIPWLPELGSRFTLELENGEREYKVTYINQGKYRFSCEPVDKGYLK
jgi:hypothetical protein